MSKENFMEISQELNTRQKKCGFRSRLARIGTSASLFISSMIGTGCITNPATEQELDISTNTPPQTEPIPSFEQNKDSDVIEVVADQVQQDTSSPTEVIPTSEPYLINADLPKMTLEEFAKNYNSVVKEFSNLTLEDISSGKLLEFELNYIKENPIFTDEVENSDMLINYLQSGSGHQIYEVFIHSNRTYAENPNKRPIKIISYYQFKDEELFARLGIDPIKNNSITISGSIAPNWPIWMVTWVYHNPSGKTIIGHSLLSTIFSHNATLDRLRKEDKDFRPLPSYKFENITKSDEEAKRYNEYIAYYLWEHYPKLQPDEGLIKDWVKTKEMPEELQNDLFLLDWYPTGW